jgi:serine/threonine protein kinase
MEAVATRFGRLRRAPAQRYQAGTLILGKYRLEAQLGEGGMGTVWLARNETLDAPVALKLIRSGMQDEETVERLLLEARVQARLNHPNIVRVFDFDQTESGDPFIVMEVLDGISLGEMLRQRGHLGAIEAVQVVLPVTGALCHAHENGVVHRDLKPDNIFLERSGMHLGIKLLDFGIAKLTSNDFHRDFKEGGTLLGSPAYMAPEQAEGSENVDHRADIWAICVVLYEAISGTAAFPGEGYDLLRRVIDDKVPALVDTGAGESALWQILSRGLEKDPARRFQSMRELGTALAQWLYDHGVSEDLDGNRISRRWGAIDLSLGSRKSLASAHQPRRTNRRVIAALRIGAAATFAIVVVLAPSKLGGEAALSPIAAQAQHGPVVEEGSICLDALLPRERQSLRWHGPCID